MSFSQVPVRHLVRPDQMTYNGINRFRNEDVGVWYVREMMQEFLGNMYKKAKTKFQKKVFKALALTRRILIEIDRSLDDLNYDVSPMWFYSTAPRKTREDVFYAKQAAVKRALYQLKKDKFIEIRREGDRVLCALTKAGRAEALKERSRMAEKLPDGYLCMLSFDVPEQERSVRRQIRRLLKDWGFKMEHQSLWSTDKDVFVPFSEYMKDLKMYKWFHIYESRILK